MKILHFDCTRGISGDMALGALVGLGVEREYLINELKKLALNLPPDFINFIDEKKIIEEEKFIEGIRIAFNFPREVGHQHHLWKDIKKLIEDAEINAKMRALAIYGKIAFAEAEAHNVALEEVEFHEVGRQAAVLTIAAVALCIELLAPEKITSTALELGGGTVRCAHGILPVPAPATAAICRGLPTHSGNFNMEMTTPSGAAIIASQADEFSDEPPAGKCVKTGYGFGTRAAESGGFLRAYLIESV
jgi:uncharacterized protein (DUF111 family)